MNSAADHPGVIQDEAIPSYCEAPDVDRLSPTETYAALGEYLARPKCSDGIGAGALCRSLSLMVDRAVARP